MVTVNSLNVGDMILVDIDDSVGQEQSGKRPWIVISIPTKRKNANDSLDVVIAVPLTRTDRKWWTVVRLSEDSFALCHNLRSLSSARTISVIERIDQKTVAKIRYVVYGLLYHPLY